MRDCVGPSHFGRYPLCRSVQYVIIDRMTVAIIGQFEPIKVKEEDMNRVIDAAGTHHGMFQSVTE